MSTKNRLFQQPARAPLFICTLLIALGGCKDAREQVEARQVAGAQVRPTVIPMPEGFRIVVVGNVEAVRTEAEVYRSQDSGDPVAVVYETAGGWVTSVLKPEPGGERIPIAVSEAAHQRLAVYVNRLGVNPPPGLTGAGLSLWLMEKADGTALGQGVR